MTDIASKIEILKRIRERNIHQKYIEYIRYPRFRNLEDNTKIDFNFPITFLVGKNGGGKSSTLQSLYGCPQGYSLGDYWFTTELDPIKEFENNRNCLIYGYKIKDDIKEVLKQRIYREGNPDYWETAKPVKQYNMTGKRNNPIEKNVVYLDFRSELSAYDKYMHFLRHKSNHKTKQDYLRVYSKKLKEALDENAVINFYTNNRNKPKKNLLTEEVQIISKILGKKFISIEVIEHNLFQEWGFSIRLKSEELNYSEAYAGSGETAIVLFVHKIFNAVEESLILLDEPETSLHSGAQKRLMEFILDMCVKKKHQFVISTHSPFLIENMPDNAIKVFSTIKKTGKFIIYSERHYKEAFHELEIENKEVKNILVEDKFAKLILDSVLKDLGDATEKMFEVKYLPGGANDINQRITTIMEFPDNMFILFDGDQKKIKEHIDLDNIPNNQQDSLNKLKELIKNQTASSVKFYLDGGNEDNEKQEIELCKKYLNYYKNNVFYFPLSIPEDIVWDEEYANKRLQMLFNNKEIKSITEKTDNSKQKLLKLCNEIYSDNKQLESVYIEFIKNWMNKKDYNLKTIKNIINNLKR